MLINNKCIPDFADDQLSTILTEMLFSVIVCVDFKEILNPGSICASFVG